MVKGFGDIDRTSTNIGSSLEGFRPFISHSTFTSERPNERGTELPCRRPQIKRWRDGTVLFSPFSRSPAAHRSGGAEGWRAADQWMDGWVGARAGGRGSERVWRSSPAPLWPARLIGRSESPVRFPIRSASSPQRSTNVGNGSRSTKCCGASIGGVALELYELRRERECRQ